MNDDLKKQHKENAEKIKKLSDAILLWMQTPLSAESQTQLVNMQDFVAHRMLELEVQGQKEKIEAMEDVLNMLKK